MEQFFKIRTISWAGFKTYVDARSKLEAPVEATAFHVERAPDYQLKSATLTKETVAPAEFIRCHDKAPLRWAQTPALTMTMPRQQEASMEGRYAFGKTVLAGLRTEPALGSSEALFVDWMLNSRVFPSPSGKNLGKQEQDFIPFSPVLEELADSLAKRFAPYVALHWRQEDVMGGKVPDFVQCARDAHVALDKLEGIKTVYFVR